MEKKFVFIEEYGIAIDVSNIFTIQRDSKTIYIQPVQCMGTFQGQFEFDTQYRAKEIQMKINEILGVKEI